MYSTLNNVYVIDISAIREFGIYPFIFDPQEHTVIVPEQTICELREHACEYHNYDQALKWLDERVGKVEDMRQLFSDEEHYRAITYDDISIVIYAGTLRRTVRFLRSCGVAAAVVCAKDASGGPYLSRQAFRGSPLVALSSPLPWDGYVPMSLEIDDGLELDDEDIIDAAYQAKLAARNAFGVDPSNFRLVLDPTEDPRIRPLLRRQRLDSVDLVPNFALSQGFFDRVVADELRDEYQMMMGMSIGCHTHEVYERYREMIIEADGGWLADGDPGHYIGGVHFLDQNQALEMIRDCGMTGSEAEGYSYTVESLMSSNIVGDDDDDDDYDDYDDEVYTAVVIENAESYGYNTLDALMTAGLEYADRVIFLYHTPVDDYFLPIQQFNRDYASSEFFYVIDDRALARLAKSKVASD